MTNAYLFPKISKEKEGLKFIVTLVFVSYMLQRYPYIIKNQHFKCAMNVKYNYGYSRHIYKMVCLRYTKDVFGKCTNFNI